VSLVGVKRNQKRKGQLKDQDMKKSDEATGCSGFQCSDEGIHARCSCCGLRGTVTVVRVLTVAEVEEGWREENRIPATRSMTIDIQVGSRTVIELKVAGEPGNGNLEHARVSSSHRNEKVWISVETNSFYSVHEQLDRGQRVVGQHWKALGHAFGISPGLLHSCCPIGGGNHSAAATAGSRSDPLWRMACGMWHAHSFTGSTRHPLEV
jgi:hypothetical protein